MDSLRGIYESVLQINRESDLLFTAIEKLKRLQIPMKVLQGLPEISLKEVAQHDEMCDCWVVIYDRVYNVTDFLRSVSLVVCVHCLHN